MPDVQVADEVEHIVNPPAELVTQSPDEHATPQAPQFKGSIVVMLQRPPQHEAPVGHTNPHPPQLFRSVVTLASQPLSATPSQSRKPVLHT